MTQTTQTDTQPQKTHKRFNAASMTHSFSVETAVEFGLDAAVLIHSFQLWIGVNRARGICYRDGRTWTFHTHRSIAAIMPYWSTRQIRYLIKKLRAKGVIMTRQDNHNPFDRTSWFAFVDEERWLGPAPEGIPQPTDDSTPLDTATSESNIDTSYPNGDQDGDQDQDQDQDQPPPPPPPPPSRCQEITDKNPCAPPPKTHRATSKTTPQTTPLRKRNLAPEMRTPSTHLEGHFCPMSIRYTKVHRKYMLPQVSPGKPGRTPPAFSPGRVKQEANHHLNRERCLASPPPVPPAPPPPKACSPPASLLPAGDDCAPALTLEPEEVGARHTSQRTKPRVKQLSDHRAFIHGWCEQYKEYWGRKYVFQDAKDGTAVARLLKRSGLSVDELLQLARAAWGKATGFLAQQAVTIAGFASRINEVQVLVGDGPQVQEDNYAHVDVRPGISGMSPRKSDLNEFYPGDEPHMGTLFITGGSLTVEDVRAAVAKKWPSLRDTGGNGHNA